MRSLRSFRALFVTAALISIAGLGLLLARPGAASNGAPAARPAPSRIVAPGTLEGATPTVSLNFEAVGQVAEVLVNEGDRVERGQLLARIDPRRQLAQTKRAEAELDAARARLALLMDGPRRAEVQTSEAELSAQKFRAQQKEQELSRMLDLTKSNAVPRSQVDAAQSDHDVATAELDALGSKLSLLRAGSRAEQRAEAAANVRLAEAELQLSQALLAETQLLAPSAGVILRRFIEPGTYVAPGGALPALTMADRARLYLRAEVDEADWAGVRVGQRGYAVPPEGTHVPGVVARISSEFGARRVGTEDPRAPKDTRVLDVLFELDAGQSLPIGLRMDLYLEKNAGEEAR